MTNFLCIGSFFRRKRIQMFLKFNPLLCLWEWLVDDSVFYALRMYLLPSCSIFFVWHEPSQLNIAIHVQCPDMVLLYEVREQLEFFYEGDPFVMKITNLLMKIFGCTFRCSRIKSSDIVFSWNGLIYSKKIISYF